MKQEVADNLRERALAQFLKSDGVEAESAEVVRFDAPRYGGQYVLVREGGEVVAVYKMFARLGPAKAVPGGGGAVIVDSFSVGLKRIKRWPKGLVEQQVQL